MHIEYQIPLLAVESAARSRAFYESLFGQTVVEDYGKNLVFSGGFGVQEAFGWLTGLPEESILRRSHNMELYFTTEDLEGFVAQVEAHQPPVELVHPVLTHPWGQRVVRLYDPDGHILEVGEPMTAVVRRFLDQGLSPEETARITEQPLELVLAQLP